MQRFAKQLLILSLFSFTFSDTAQAQVSLWLVEKSVSMKFSVANIDEEDLKTALNSEKSSNTILFDTRKFEEFQVSHLRSAIQVNPEMDTKTFIKKYGHLLKNKQLVFYCSVGYRSSEFAERVQEEALQLGADSVANLKGGIFRWYNEGHTVVNQAGKTNDIHPYNEEWGELVESRVPSSN